MQTFEFHFNPKVKPNLIFDSFCFEPANVYEKRVGSLYMAGFLKNALPQNIRFLDNLARKTRDFYYKFTLKSPEKALRETLKLINEYLESLTKKGDVSWLGNISFATLSLKNFELNFTKVGDVKIILLRKGQIIDIDKRLKFQDLEPYPLKVFPNIVSGKLAENDIILILTKDVFNSFQNNNLISKMAQTSVEGSFDGRKIKEILQKKTQELSKIFGTCLLVYLGAEEETASSRQIITPEKISPKPKKSKLKQFSFKNVFTPLLTSFKNYLGKNANLNFPTFHFPIISLKDKKLYKILQSWNRNIILVSILIFFLGIGFLISEKEEGRKLESYKITFNQVQEKTEKAKNLLTLKEVNSSVKKQVADMFNEAWDKIIPVVEVASTLPTDFQKNVLSLKNEIVDNLFVLNKMVRIDNPELAAQVNSEQIISQKIIADDKNIYLFSPYSPNLAKISKESGKIENIQNNNEKINFAGKLLNNSLLFFSKPNKISLLADSVFSETSLSASQDFNQLTVFNSNLYFLDKDIGKIIKYPYVNEKWGQAEDWMQNNYAAQAKSIAVDGSVWLLNPDNTLSRFYAGRFRETVKVDIFPQPENFSKISIIPSLPYIYILDPAQKRIIIINKSGQIVKQFQSEKFDTLLDFSVSDDGKIIYLLNGQKVYKIKTSDS